MDRVIQAPKKGTTKGDPMFDCTRLFDRTSGQGAKRSKAGERLQNPIAGTIFGLALIVASLACGPTREPASLAGSTELALTHHEQLLGSKDRRQGNVALSVQLPNRAGPSTFEVQRFDAVATDPSPSCTAMVIPERQPVPEGTRGEERWTGTNHLWSIYSPPTTCRKDSSSRETRRSNSIPIRIRTSSRAESRGCLRA